MKLGAKVMSMMGAATAGMALALYAVSHLIVRTGYLNLEQHHARTDVDRAMRAIEERKTQLGIAVADWSLWDDSYRFVQDRNPVFIKENLIPTGYVTLKLHSLLIVDTSNTIVWGQAVDSRGTGFTPLPPELQRFAEAGSARFLPGSEQNLIAGIVMLEAGPMVLAAHRMLPSSGEGPARGTLIMGRMLDSAAIEELSAALQLRVSTFRVDALPADDLPDGVLAALSEGTPGEIRVLDRTAIAGYGLVRDLYGNPALVVEVRMPRDIFAQGLRTSSILGNLVLLVTLGFSGAVVIMLRRQVTSRLARLSRDISFISDAGNFSRRVALTGSDELSAVADNVNRLLAGVVESRRALLKSEERIRHIIESTTDWIWEIDPSGLFTYASPAVERILGYRPDEIVGRKHFYDLFAPAGREPLTRAALEMISRKESLPALVNANVHKDGHEVVLETSGVPVLDEQGALVGYRGADRDVTERHRTEAALASAATEARRLLAEAEKSRRALLSLVEDQKRAEAERERLMLAIEQAAETIVITDADGTIQYVNPVFTRTTGYRRDEAVGQNSRILRSGCQDKAFYCDMWRTISSGATWAGQMVNRRKDGALYTEESTISPVRDATGRIVNYVAVKRDITEQLHHAAQLQQAQKMESVGRLAGGVAHDFNNLLMGIMGYAELCRDSLEPSNPLRTYLDEIMNGARRSAAITRQLLAFARKQTITPKVLDLNDSVSSMLKLLQRLIGEDIDLTWMPCAGSVTVHMDPSQVDQILANLCVNARDAISGVGKVTVETGHLTVDNARLADKVEAPPGEYVMLAVSDNGCGMDAATLDRVFEPFFTTKDVGQGTGLGLATVHGIVKQNNGFVDVTSEPGKGTTFRIYLPRCAEEVADPAADGAAEAYPGGTETVLLVEDEQSIRVTTQAILEKLGYAVLTAESPEKALRLVTEYSGRIHLLLTDVVMPGMSGHDLAQQLLGTRPGIRCLYMSGYTASSIAHHGILDKDVAFLAKPFSRSDLARKVREVLDDPKTR
jgi:PAS domain S-box-containing protein